MRLTNYKKLNIYNETLEKFSNENRGFFFGSVRGKSSDRYKWVADFKFKHRNNVQSNKHNCFIDFYGNRDMLLSDYGNTKAVWDKGSLAFQENKKKFSDFRYELSSTQYMILGQEHAGFDEISYFDASGQLAAEMVFDDNEVSIKHDCGDVPALISAGYAIDNRYYIWANEPESIQVNHNNIIVKLNDSESDIFLNEEYIEMAISYPVGTAVEGGSVL